MAAAVDGQPPAVRPSLPLVDLSLPAHVSAPLLREACEGPGFFFVTNHGVPNELVARVFQEVEALFNLPPEEKAKIGQDANNRGYTAMEEEALDPARQKTRGDTKEGYYIGPEIPADHPRAKLPLHGPNVWPSPDLLPSFRGTMEAYHSACLGVAFRLLRVMALALGLPEGYFLRPGMFDNAMAFLRPLHYAREPSKPGEGVFGCGAHTDYGMLTLLAITGPGLQICRDRGAEPQQWEAVEAVEGALIVNLGDMLERWTNGKWRSTLHRVVIPEGAERDRYSVPFFLDPNFDCVVHTLPGCASPENPPRWPPSSAGEHLLSMYKQTHKNLDETLKAV